MAKMNYKKFREDDVTIDNADDSPEVKKNISESNLYTFYQSVQILSNAAKRKAELEIELKAIDEKYERKKAVIKEKFDAAMEESYRREREALAKLRRRS